MSELVILLWSFWAGFFWARYLDRKPTTEHEIGAKIMEAGRSVISTRRFTGDGVSLTNVCTLTLRQGKVNVSVSDYSVTGSA